MEWFLSRLDASIIKFVQSLSKENVVVYTALSIVFSNGVENENEIWKRRRMRMSYQTA